MVNNLIENNGIGREAAGIRVRGHTHGLILEGNTIRDTRPIGEQRQRVGIRLEQNVGEVALQGNRITAEREVADER
jgi:hypothetical protein